MAIILGKKPIIETKEYEDYAVGLSLHAGNKFQLRSGVGYTITLCMLVSVQPFPAIQIKETE